MIFLSSNKKIEELSKLVKYYILDKNTRQSFMVTNDAHTDQGRNCKKGTFFKQYSDGMRFSAGVIYNSELTNDPDRYDFTKELKEAYKHCATS